MADLDYGAAVGPMKKVVKSVVLNDNTSGTAITLSLVDFDGTAMANIPRRVSASYKPNGTRPSGGPVVVETDDQEVSLTLAFGLKSWKGATAHTPIQFMKGETVNSIPLVSTGVGGRFLFEMVVTYDSTVDGGASQTLTYAYCELVSGTEEERDGILYVNVSITDHENEPTAA